MEEETSVLCKQCKKRPAIEGGSRCEDCRASRARYRRKLRNKRKSAGLCPGCGSDYISEGRIFCEDCLAVKRAEKRGLHVRKGILCEECHERPPLLSFIFCRQCLWKIRKEHPELYLKFNSDRAVDMFNDRLLTFNGKKKKRFGEVKRK